MINAVSFPRTVMYDMLNGKLEPAKIEETAEVVEGWVSDLSERGVSSDEAHVSVLWH